MPPVSQSIDRSCQLQLELALLRHRYNIDHITNPSITDPNYQYTALENLQTTRKRMYNLELLQHYRIALNIRETHGKFNKSLIHKVGCFLLDYFEDEFDAILHLENITPSTIERLTTRNKQRIISEKTSRLDDHPAPDQRPVSHETNDLWRHFENKQDNQSLLDDIFDDDSPPSSRACLFFDTPYARPPRRRPSPATTRRVTRAPVTDSLFIQNIVSPFSF
jgi:hypothetical protein